MNRARLAEVGNAIDTLQEIETDPGRLHLDGPVWLLGSDNERVAQIEWHGGDGHYCVTEVVATDV